MFRQGTSGSPSRSEITGQGICRLDCKCTTIGGPQTRPLDGRYRRRGARPAASEVVEKQQDSISAFRRQETDNQDQQRTGEWPTWTGRLRIAISPASM